MQIRTVFAALIVLATASGWPQVSRAADRRASPPNIVYIVADDLGYPDIGAQGLSKDVRTPHIDSIAAAGVRFTNGYVSCPVCSPTRAGLMTGRYQQRFGHEFNPGPNGAPDFGLPTDQITLPQALKEAGYATGMVGKWHLGFTSDKQPVARGFDTFYGFLGGAHPYDASGKGRNALMRDDRVVESTGYLTDVLAQEALKFIDQHAADRAKGGKPFFLYFAFNAVHSPQEAPQKYLERFAGESDEKRRLMLAMLSALDDSVGQVLAALDRHGLARDTMIIFHSDNGGPTWDNGSVNTPLRGHKGDVYEGGVRVAFMMKWPGHIAAGKVYEHPVIALDTFPTALAAAGAAPPANVQFDGVNLLPFLSNADPATGAAASVPHPTLYWRYGATNWAIRDGNFKLVHMGRDPSPQLFDLSNDLSEARDLSHDKPDVVKALQQKYDAWNAELVNPRWTDSRQGRNEGRNRGGPRNAR